VWASKSDETRAQNLSYIFEKYKGEEWFSTEKIDGQSALYGIVKGKFYVCSRNLRCLDPKKGGSKSNHWDYAVSSSMEAILKQMREYLGYDFYIQGELAGPSIQGNKYNFPERCLFVFNMRNLKTNNYLPYGEMKYLCNRFGLTCVPFLKNFTWSFENMSQLLAEADGYSVFGNKVLREGIVLRSKKMRAPDANQSNMCSLKVISPSFDIKHSK
jgi:RNA ligase (TIGR02306 family)